ncbi:hypothetical protein [Streptomyces cucumeris]|uniref:hypothetical protein n=1 Tax=Streptomyces cucumeris TaxID=2962890 RepID=UPI0020C83DC0|nr:hypothetical protein [Streptomyces sp. NEAU-Y11]MCP9209566.1 hypothetical protein [Streptomyces sp. NEAU-Y11]
MAMTDDIKIKLAGHGLFQTNGHHFDQLMAKYLPASVAELRDGIGERIDIDYSDLETVTECLMVLAELDGLATN